MCQAKWQFKNTTVQMPTDSNQPTIKNKTKNQNNQPTKKKKNPSNMKLSGQVFGPRKVF